jgi:hypothetical protein
MPANTVLEFAFQKITSLPDPARLAVLFDPYAKLDLAASVVDGSERTWQVTTYDGNDLAFRKQQLLSSSGRRVIWVVLPEYQRGEIPPRMAINSLPDIWFRADLILDVSVLGILRELAPAETWPILPLWEQASVFSKNLQSILPALQDLRRYLERNAALDESVIRALALHCYCPDLPAQEFLFHLDTPVRVLHKYLSLLWNGQWTEDGRKLLQTQALKAPHISTETIQPWLMAAPVELARYIYLRQALKRFEVPNPVNQLRGLGMFELDPELLESHSIRLLDLWEQNPIWKQEIIQQAEASLNDDDIHRLVDLFELRDPQSVLQAMQQAETPAILSDLLVRFIQVGLTTSENLKFSTQWLRPVLLSSPIRTRFSEACTLLASILDEIAFIDSCREVVLPDTPELARLLDWYTENKLYELEYAQARAAAQVMRVPVNIRLPLRRYLNGQRKWLKSFLNECDHLLAKVISSNWNGYLGHPRLSTNVLWDTVKRKRLRATLSSRLWVVVFDGMRWDTWMRHVRPRLLETFEMIETDKPYISLLPSWTRVARTGLLAGRIPGNWLNEQGRSTTSQLDLAARLLEVKRQEIHFSSNMETDQKLSQLLEQGNLAYNVLIYNISDDNLHAIKGNLVDLNKSVDSIMERVIQDLSGLVGENDTIIISSDHGFTELDEEFAVSITDDTRWQRQTDGLVSPIRYRYIIGNQIPPELSRRNNDVLKVVYKNYPDEYIVPVGNLWFKRVENTGPTDRYGHGGVSFAEMVVPGAVLRPITQRVIRPEFEFVPKSVEVVEGEIVNLSVRLVNKGNTIMIGNISIQADLGGEALNSTVNLSAGNRQEWSYPVVGFYRKLSGNREEITKSVKVVLTYKGLEGQEVHVQKRVSVIVQPRTDKVDIDFGGLPDLD